MFEKLIDTIVLLIAALQENTASRRNGVVHIDAPDAVEVPAATTPPLPPSRKKKETPPPPPAEKPAAPNFAAAPAAKKSYTQEQVNEHLVNTWTRLGSDENAGQKCNDLLAEFGTNSVLGLKPSQYAEIIEKADALV